MAVATSRRRFVGALAAAPIAAVVAFPVAATAPDTSAWRAALAEHCASEAHLNAVCIEKAKAETAYFAAREALERPDGIIRVGDTMDAYNARQRAQRTAYEARLAELHDETGLTVADRAEDAAQERCTAALTRLLDMPTPTLAAAIDKLEIAIEMDEPTAGILADLRRFAEAA